MQVVPATPGRLTGSAVTPPRMRQSYSLPDLMEKDYATPPWPLCAGSGKRFSQTPFRCCGDLGLGYLTLGEATPSSVRR